MSKLMLSSLSNGKDTLPCVCFALSGIVLSTQETAE